MFSDIADEPHKVLVTNATKFIAGWVIRHFLDAGYVVHATVHAYTDYEDADELTRLAEGLSGKLHLFEAGRNRPQGFLEAMEGCHLVFHTSSAFDGNFEDAENDLIIPTVKGVENVLYAANQTESVRRVVLTSSCTTMYGDNADLVDEPDGIITEEMWNKTSTADHQPYCYAKTKAEKLAFEIAANQSRWSLITINPGLVLGPSLTGTLTTETHRIIRQLADGSSRFGVPKLEIGAVDVRDLANVHFKAGVTPSAHGRYLVFESPITLFEMSNILRAEFGDRFAFGKNEIPTWLLATIGPKLNRFLTRKMVLRNMGFPWRGDNSRAKTELGITYRLLDEPLIEMFYQLIENGLVSASN